jgi:hypothetical protein
MELTFRQVPCEAEENHEKLHYAGIPVEIPNRRYCYTSVLGQTNVARYHN